MTLDAYLAKPDAKSLTELAQSLEISKGRLSQLRHASEWPADLALKAEAATGGALNASVLSATVARARKGMAA